MNVAIYGHNGNGCDRLATPSARNPDICVLVGETLEFMCNRSGGDPQSIDPQITTPGGVTVNSPLTVTTVQPSSDGLFQCKTQCGATNATIDVQVFSK